MQDPPPPPARLIEMTRVVGVGTVLWFLAGVALLVAHVWFGRPIDVWSGACAAGVLLGLIGYAVFRWQRRAARRGSRTAQSGLN